LDDTITAIATPPGVGGIGIIRLSGDRALPIAKSVIRGLPDKPQIESYKLFRGKAYGHHSNPIDTVLASYMPAPTSYTGEDVVEINSHGNALILNQITKALIKAGARVAEKGEFTKRAYLNGKIDLTKAEAVLDLITAKTESARQIAYNQLEGGLAERVRAIKDQVVEIVARIEAEIDFPEDVTGVGQEEIIKISKKIIRQIERLLKTADEGRIIREGIKVVIAGRTNVGKSTLMNRLLGEERVIVTETPGTTRDTIEEEIDMAGRKYILIDTAGIREARQKAEKMGVEKAKREISEAGLILLVIDGSSAIKKDDLSLLKATQNIRRMIIFNKHDLPKKVNYTQIAMKEEWCQVSALTGEGVERLKQRIGRIYRTNKRQREDGWVCINGRHQQALERAKTGMLRAAEACQEKQPKGLIAVDLKEAIKGLGEISGEEAAEEIIKTIFERFCVGK
jgi:tRNA modification GTPase